MSSGNGSAFGYLPPAEVSIEELNKMTNEILKQFALNSQHPNGSFQLPVTNWSHWAQDRENRLGKPHQFIENMEIRAAIHNLTVEDVIRRLTMSKLVRAQAAGLSSILQRITFGGPSPSLYWNSTKREIELETQDHSELIRDGGRPFYKGTDIIALLARNRHSWESLSQLRNVKVWPDSSIRVCQKQRLRWQMFREWQRNSRGIKGSWALNPDIWLVRRLEAEKRECLGNTPRFIERLARYEAKPDFLMQLWYQDSLARETLQRQQEEKSGNSDIDSHALAVMSILKRNGLYRNHVLLQDPEDQDKITEWIEYVAWEYLQMEDRRILTRQNELVRKL